MTIGRWLDARGSDVPANLAARIREALGPDLERDAAEAPERCVAAADRLVGALLETDSTGRDSALALLAADALVTYAFEAAAEAPESLPERTASAMRTLAILP